MHLMDFKTHDLHRPFLCTPSAGESVVTLLYYDSIPHLFRFVKRFFEKFSEYFILHIINQQHFIIYYYEMVVNN